MDFKLYIEYLKEFIAFVKPVSGLISDFFQAMGNNIPEFNKVTYLVFGGVLLSVLVGVIYKTSNS